MVKRTTLLASTIAAFVTLMGACFSAGIVYVQVLSWKAAVDEHMALQSNQYRELDERLRKIESITIDSDDKEKIAILSKQLHSLSTVYNQRFAQIESK